MTYLARVLAGIVLFMSTFLGYRGPSYTLDQSTINNVLFGNGESSSAQGGWSDDSATSTPIVTTHGTWTPASELSVANLSDLNTTKWNPDDYYWKAQGTDTIYCYDKPLTPTPDAATFEVNQKSVDAIPVAKDKDTVWIGCDVLAGADPATFTPTYKVISLNPSDNTLFLVYAADLEHIWIYEPPDDGGNIDPAVNFMIPVASADPSTFTYIASEACDMGGFDYFRDSAHVYSDKEIVSWADPSTFELVTDNCYPEVLKDKDHVYVNATLLAGADPASFVSIRAQSWWYAKDANHVYTLDGQANTGMILENADPATFTIIPEVTSNTIGKSGKQKTNQVPATVNGMKVDAKDANHYYYNGKVVQ